MCENIPLFENHESELPSRRMKICLVTLAVGLFILVGVWAFTPPYYGIPVYTLSLTFKEKYQNNNKGFNELHETKETESVKLEHVEDSTHLKEELLENKFRVRRDAWKQEEKEKRYATLIRIPRDTRIKREKETDTKENGIEGENDSNDGDSEDKPIGFPVDDFMDDDYEPCEFPSSLKTAEILCKIWSDIVVCKSYCAYGYTYSEGIARTSVCSKHEDTWTKKFEECEPFVDCKLKLISPGRLHCVQNRLATSPTCFIQCVAYAEHKAMERDSYACKSNGKWEPPLPFCVALRGWSKLVKAPKVTEHVNISYPTKPNTNYEGASVEWILDD